MASDALTTPDTPQQHRIKLKGMKLKGFQMTRLTFRRVAVVAFAVVLPIGATVACSDSESGSSSVTTAAAGVSVSDPWARVSAADAANGAVYFVVANGSSVEDRLLSARVSTEVALETQIHETIVSSAPATEGMDNMTAGTGMMQMQEVGSVTIPAGSSVEFKPGGYHVMLIDLTDPLVVGQSFPMTLTFADAGEVEVLVQVRTS